MWTCKRFRLRVVKRGRPRLNRWGTFLERDTLTLYVPARIADASRRAALDSAVSFGRRGRPPNACT